MTETIDPVEQVQRLYGEGKFGEALDLIGNLLGQELGEEQYRELVAIKAWCHYQQKEYDDARSYAKASRLSQRSQELLATIAAYVDKDEEELLEYAAAMPGNIAVQNAVVIRARDQTSVITRREVLKAAMAARIEHGVKGAHLQRNAARFLMEKPQDNSDLVLAEGFLAEVIALYRFHDVSPHHLAAAYHWLSVALERRFGKAAAREAAGDSIRLWKHQVRLDPTNKAFQEKLEKAKSRWEELSAP